MSRDLRATATVSLEVVADLQGDDLELAAKAFCVRLREEYGFLIEIRDLKIRDRWTGQQLYPWTISMKEPG